MSKDRIEINRANAQHSTGPRTEEGKKRSSLNALRHGLTSDNVLIPGEDPEIYNAHVAGIYAEHNPQTETESVLVQLLADLSWRLLRVATLEANLLAQNINYSTFNHQNERLTAFDKLSRALSNLSLYSQRISRQFERTVAQLRELQQARKAAVQKAVGHAAGVMQMPEIQGEPSEHGFVFSDSSIAGAIPARDRQNLAPEAGEFIAEA